MATPTEREIRRAVIADMKSDPHALVVEELALTYYGARIDVSSVNGVLSGVEIKTDFDSLDRLGDQAVAYNQVFDFVTLVVGGKHFPKVLDSIPIWWGISVAESENGNTVLQIIREPGRNPSPEPIAIASLLWKDELLRVIRNCGVVVGERYTRRDLIHSLSQLLDLDSLRDSVRECLLCRVNWRVEK